MSGHRPSWRYLLRLEGAALDVDVVLPEGARWSEVRDRAVQLARVTSRAVDVEMQRVPHFGAGPRYRVARATVGPRGGVSWRVGLEAWPDAETAVG